MVSALFLTFGHLSRIKTPPQLDFNFFSLLFFSSFKIQLTKWSVALYLSRFLFFFSTQSIINVFVCRKIKKSQSRKLNWSRFSSVPFFRFSSLHLLFFRTEILTRTGTSFVQGYPEIFFPFRNLTSKAICLLISQMVVRVVVRRSWKSEFHEWRTKLSLSLSLSLSFSLAA